ncbi:NAD(P)/FAD-dependent oxidoreductase [Caldivirga maquilingensis]|uniref:FAD dependent oxidoreductase n=1 Tax=Caldivirga maquilingensis (strain ATCC 700844 / DSM 13496 / JCM 10307 / IC-167) TaxID=397948 RepID=A8MC36_CALMQ|nr:FAD-binding oxidoreductase [Caldivirga maquilingensis]ABW01342.1 FAD dependent oxidoreductase [Caldivirga maquilingensis IC-167]
MRVVVVGGGIAALFTAYFLKSMGSDVVVIGEEPKYPLASLVLTQSMPYVDDILLARESLEVYRRFTKPKPVTSIDIMPRWINLNPLKTAGVEYRIIEEADWVRLSRDEFMVVTTDYMIPIRRIVGELRRRMNVIKAKASLKLINGSLTVVANGERYIGDSIVLAAGPGNTELAMQVGIKLPLKSYQCYASVMTGPVKVMNLSIGDDVLGWYSRPFIPGLFIAGDGCGKPNEKPPPNYGQRIARLISSRFGWAAPIFTRSGTCEVSPSGGPVYGMVKDNLYVLGGLDGYGSMSGPALARRLAELLIKGDVPMDDYRVEKYMNHVDWDACSVERHNWLIAVQGKEGKESVKPP